MTTENSPNSGDAPPPSGWRNGVRAQVRSLRHMPVRSRLRLSYLALACLTALVGGIGAYFTYAVSSEYKRIARSSAPAMTALGYVKSHAIQIVGHVDDAVHELESGEAEFNATGFGSSRERLNSWTNQYTKIADDDVRRQYAAIIEQNGALIGRTSEKMLELAGGGSIDEIDRERKKLEQIKTTLIRTIDSAIQTEVRALNRGGSAVEDVVMLAMVLGFTEALIAVVLAVSLGANVSTSINRPVSTLIKASRRLGEGRFETRIPVDGPSDLAELSAGFNRMAKQLEELDRESDRKNQQLEEKVGQLLDAEAKLRFEATHDALTGLSNRVLLESHLSRCLERRREETDYHFAILFLDLDRFKMVNDSLGHQVGDQLLVEASRRLDRSVRGLDTVIRVERETTARFGGDEFAILLDGIRNPGRVVLIAERIQEALSEPFILGGHEIQMRTSIGIALSTGRYQTADEMLRDADTAMYRAKVAGGAQHALFDDEMHCEAMDRLRLENDLRRAVSEHRFLIRYQPIIDLAENKVIAFEALIRWNHPELGIISPTRFIKIAEETGLIVPIGRWIMRNAARQLAAWRRNLPDDHPLSVSVNVSPRQVEGTDIVDEVSHVLRDAGIEARHLRLEITESMLMSNQDQVLRVLRALKSLGCELHMDDFGTGYSSLSSLHKFPLDVLKIDREFVSNMGNDREYAAVVRAIMTLAHSLDMRVTAEGLETAHQLALIKSLNCNYGQGYYFAKPLTASEAWELLTSDSVRRTA